MRSNTFQTKFWVAYKDVTDDTDDDDDDDDEDDDDDDVCVGPMWYNTSHTVVQWFSYLSSFIYFGSSSELIRISVTVSGVS